MINVVTGVTCPRCTDPDHPPPDPRLVTTDTFWCPGCRREFVAYTPAEYADAIAESRPGVLVGDLLRGVPGRVPGIRSPHLLPKPKG
jgi:hypothetical protein